MRKQHVVEFLSALPKADLEESTSTTNEKARPDISALLQSLDLGEHVDQFLAEDITLEVLPELCEGDLKELGLLKMGQRKKLMKAIRYL
jgi:hypothetical protein